MKLRYYKYFLLYAGFSFGCLIVGAQQDDKRDDDSVHIAYGKQEAAKITSAISTVKGEKLQKSFTPNLANTLYGRIPGLTVMQQNTEPGLESPALLIRGIGTFRNERTPLIIVDGFESDFEQLTSYEIETISALKDAAATALYGMKGANGVLLVTTKRGKISPLKVSFTTQHGANQATDYPRFLDSYNYARLYNEALRNDGKPELYSESDLQAYQNGSDPYFHPNVNWYDKVLAKSAYVSNYNLSFTGGSPNIRYFGMLSALNNHSLLIRSGNLSENSVNSNYRRYNFRTNVDVNLTKRLTATLLLGGSVEDKANPMANNTNSLFNLIATLPPNIFPARNPDSSYGGSSVYANPYANVLESGMFTSNGRTIQSTLRLKHELDMIASGLSIDGAVSFNNFFKNYSSKTRQYERFAISKDAAGDTVYTKFGQNTSLVGSENQSEQWRNLSFQGILSYLRSFGSGDVDAMLIAQSDNYTLMGQEYPFKHASLGGRVNYTFQRKYIAEFSFSYMGSDNYAPGKRVGFFPAASVGWVLSNENFLKDNSTINFLKLRASYGVTGNQDYTNNRYAFDQTYTYPGSYYFGTGNSSASSLTEGRLANPDATWEKDKKLNIGLDVSLLKRLILNVDVFNNDRYDILVTPSGVVPGFYGISLPLINQGRVKNSGFEFNVNYNSNQERAFQYFINAGVWYAKNKIVDMAEEAREFPYQVQTGGRIGQPFGLEAIGFFRDATDIQSSPVHTFVNVKPGDIKYKDQNGDGLINLTDYVAIGNPSVPDLNISLNPGFNYKNFDFEFLLQSVKGRSAYLSGLEYQALQNNGQISSIALNRWTEQTAATATYPRLSTMNNANNFRYSSFWQRNGDFIKLRSIELGYRFVDGLFSRLGISGSRIYLNGTNLLTWDKQEYNDAERPSGFAGYPPVRTVSMGLKLDF